MQTRTQDSQIFEHLTSVVIVSLHMPYMVGVDLSALWLDGLDRLDDSSSLINLIILWIFSVSVSAWSFSRRACS